MALIQWKEEFKLGIPSVDQEHEELIGLINELYQHYTDAEARATVQKFWGEVYAKIASHFALEETIMKARRYDEYGKHKDDHEILLDEICEFMDEFDRSESLDEVRLGEFLETWFVNHFRDQDARLHKHLD